MFSLNLKDSLTMDDLVEKFDSFKKRFRPEINRFITDGLQKDSKVKSMITLVILLLTN